MITHLSIKKTSLILTCCIKTVSLYHFKLVSVVLLMNVKEFLNPASKNGEISILGVIFDQP